MAAAGEAEPCAVAYVLAEFPSVSETFVLREIMAVERHGVRIVPLALRRPQSSIRHAPAVAWEHRTAYRPRPLSLSSLGALVWAAVRHPVGMASTLWLIAGTLVRKPALLRELFSALAAAAAFAHVARREDVRHVHAQFASVTATVAWLLAELLGLPLSISCHARDIWTAEASLLTEKLRESEFVTVCTQVGYDRLQGAYPLAVGGKLHLVRHGVDLTEFHPSARRPEQPPLVLSVGRLVEKKGFDVLLLAAADLRQHGVEFRLAIVGEGPLRPRLEAMIADLGLHDAATLAGALAMEDVRALYARAAVFVVASVVAEDGDRDGLPNVLLEAGAMELPIVAAATSAIPELIVDGETGLLVEPRNPSQLADRIAQVLADSDLAARLGAAARAAVASAYVLDRNAALLEALLRQAASPRCAATHQRPGRGHVGRP